MWTRQTYSILDWLGDLGGLFDALAHVCRVLISPISVFALKSSLLTSFFRFKPSEEPREDFSNPYS